ncbi:MAG: DUF4349 domain-containing protein [Lachnospiraceae bacterium]|nr:DUF4349 domain-containing protein [Lachnospiraceae bacterium]
MTKNRKSIFIWMACIMLMAGLLAGCGSSTKNDAVSEMAVADTASEEAMVSSEYKTEAAVEDAAGAAEEEGNTSAGTVEDPSRKLIKTENIDAQTKNFDDLLNNVRSKVTELGGYIEHSNIYSGTEEYNTNRNAYFAIRIPEEKLDTFVENVKAEANVTNQSTSVEDITLTYTDTESHIKALKTEQESLLAMLEKATELDDLIAIQSRLTDVRYELESYESQLRTYDNQVSYSTVNLNITEVDRESNVNDQSFGGQLKEKFMSNLYGLGNGLENFALWFLSSLPFILIWVVILAVIAWIVILILRKTTGHPKTRKERKAAKDAQNKIEKEEK